MYSCPHCHKEVKNLKKHIKRMHPDQVEKGPESKTKGLQFEVKKPKETKAKEETETAASGYHCVDCGGPLEKDQAICPKCGARLDWSAL